MGIEFFILMKSEWALMLIIFILLIIKVNGTYQDNAKLLLFTNVLLGLNFVLGFVYNQSGMLFNSMFHTSSLIAFEKNILNFATLIISLQAYTWLKNHKHMLEYYMLLLTTLLGMFFMISSGNFLMFYLGLELAAIPLAALVNFDLDKLKSSEAAMKMILLSAFASGIMLFGISMIYGTTGSLNFAELPALISGSHLQILALIFIFTGFAFKLSVVPFHLWTADVYEGAPVSITAYLSVVSKAAIVFVLISTLSPLFGGLTAVWYNILFISIILTIIVGNLFAIRQQNIKRFLAFSSIAQVGFILLAISAGTPLSNTAAIFFLIVYTLSNLGVFGVIALVSDETGKENIDDYKGFYKTNPALGWVIALSLFSLAGIPPTAGFFGKMFLITAGASKGSYILVGIAALNMVVSLYYYLKIVKTVFIDPNAEPIMPIKTNMYLKLSLGACMIGIVITGFTSGLYDYIYFLFRL